MEQLIKQMEIFAENVTEQGTVAYHSTGDELDALTKALLIALFEKRIELK